MKDTDYPDEQPGDELLKVLNQGEYLILAKIECDGEPRGVPFNYIIKDNFNDLAENSININITSNKKIKPSKFGTLYERLSVSGDVSLVEDHVKRQRILSEFLHKYSSGQLTGDERENFLGSIVSKAIVINITVGSNTGRTGNKKNP